MNGTSRSRRTRGSSVIHPCVFLFFRNRDVSQDVGAGGGGRPDGSVVEGNETRRSSKRNVRGQTWQHDTRKHLQSSGKMYRNLPGERPL